MIQGNTDGNTIVLSGGGEAVCTDGCLLTSDITSWTGTKEANCETEIIGTWLGGEINGLADGWSSTVTCNNLYINGPSNQEWYKGTYIIDETSDPDQIDYYITECSFPEGVGTTALGIYELEGNTLTIAFSQPGASERPSNFLPDTGARIFVFSK